MTEKQRQTILFVDDDETSHVAISHGLNNEYDVLTASSASEALGILAARAVDVVISDHHMPEITGVELFQKVSTQYPLVGRILLTGSSYASEVMEAAINLGAVDKYMEKPWNIRLLKELIQQVLRARAIVMAASRSEIESQLIHCDKMASLGGLLAGIAHEINNPLSFISSNLNNLAKFNAKIFDLLACYEQLDLPVEMRALLEKKKETIDLT